MSFRFDWSTVASKELLRDIRTRINTVLYKVASKDNYQGNTMHLLSLDLGTEEPEIKLLDINELSEEKVKMSFGFCYDGNATLKFRATVQLNPLVSNKRLGERGRQHMGVCCSHYSYPVSIFLVLSQFRLEGKVVISYVNPNYHKTKAAANGYHHTAIHHPPPALHLNTTAASGPIASPVFHSEEGVTPAADGAAAAAAAAAAGASGSHRRVEIEEVDPYSKTTMYNYANTQDEREEEGKPTTAYCEIAIKNEAFKSVNVRSSFDGCSGAEERVQSKVDDKLTRAFKFLLNNPIRFPIKPPTPAQQQQLMADRKSNTTAAAGTATGNGSSSPPQHKTAEGVNSTAAYNSTYETGAQSPLHPPLPAPILIPASLPVSTPTHDPYAYDEKSNDSPSATPIAGTVYYATESQRTAPAPHHSAAPAAARSYYTPPSSASFGAAAAAASSYHHSSIPEESDDHPNGLHVTSSATSRTGTITHYSFAPPPPDDESSGTEGSGGGRGGGGGDDGDTEEDDSEDNRSYYARSRPPMQAQYSHQYNH